MGPKSPFMFVGALDICVTILVVILGCCGVIKNDIKERKVQADKINAERDEIEKALTEKNVQG